MSLVDRFDAAQEMGFIKQDVPAHVLINLSPSVALRSYQNQALGRLFYYLDGYSQRVRPTHLLFHMATGSGKTVIMAAAILDLYARGYRDFLFFVDKAQIVEKTKANFLEPSSSKYLFAPALRFDDKPVTVREVSNFAESTPDAINIRFTTLGTLHSQIKNPRENGVTLEDFEQRDKGVVLIADEAHHLNAETKANPGQGELDLKDSWESTVNAIFRSHHDNVMLDFTATQDFRNPAIAAKYDDKILFDFSLKRFREEGYSKDILIRSVGTDATKRMLQAALLSEHRRRLAEANGLAIKPVVLMKSRQIAESKANKAAFEAALAALDGTTLLAMRPSANDDPALAAAFAYMLDERGIDPEDLARDMRRQFAPDHLIDANDDKELAARQLALNTLEDSDNCYRVVFAVDKLNEGWDVLNLYDIVRLYDARTNSTSNAEKQLIGRGARYCPFVAPGKPELPRDKRKYDDDTAAPLRLLEQLHYHCAHDPDYIRHIRAELVSTGALAPDPRDVTIRLKGGFRESDFFKSGLVWANALIENDRAGMTRLSDYDVPKLIVVPSFGDARVTETDAFDGEGAVFGAQAVGARRITFPDLGRPVIRRALDGHAFFRFDRLRRHFPQLGGMATFIESPQFLGGVQLDLSGPVERLDPLAASDRLDIARYALNRIATAVATRSIDRTGSTEFKPGALSALFGEDKTVRVAAEGEGSKSWRESPILRDRRLDQKDWFVFDDNYGTDQEKLFIRWMDDRADQLKERWSEFYLIRNERVVALYDFENGRRFEPDFLLFLTDREDGAKTTLQLFVEPKGTHLEQGDAWKQDFLLRIGKEGVAIYNGKDYRVIGLPFFNDEAGRKQRFEQAFASV